MQGKWLIAPLVLGTLALAPVLWAQAGTQPGAGEPLPAMPLPADLPIKRLILKDGSYQPVEKFEIRSDRVRYLSAERYEWEEVPYSLVDWAATGKYAREAAAHSVSADAKAVDAEEQAERKEQDELTPLVAPGLRLPATGGVFLLDVYHRQAQLNEIEQNGGEVRANTGKNILRATINPLASHKRTVELIGAHARIQSHAPNPFFYVDLPPEEETPSSSSSPHAETGRAEDSDLRSTTKNSNDLKDRFRLIRVETVPKKKVRVAGIIKVPIYGKVSQDERFVPAKVEAFSGPWLKVTPTEPLETGEYALVEILGHNQMNLYVWDFGVNPNAPENPGAWRPQTQ